MITVIVALSNGQRFIKQFISLVEARLEVSGLTFPVSWSANVGGEMWSARPHQYPSKEPNMKRYYCYNLNGGCTGVATLTQQENGVLIRGGYGSPCYGGGVDDSGPSFEVAFADEDQARQWLKRQGFEVQP